MKVVVSSQGGGRREGLAELKGNSVKKALNPKP